MKRKSRSYVTLARFRSTSGCGSRVVSIDAFEVLRSEATVHPRMMSIGMHARILGQPGRVVGLLAFLDHLEGREDVWVCRRHDIAEHWRAVAPPSNEPG